MTKTSITPIVLSFSVPTVSVW